MGTLAAPRGTARRACGAKNGRWELACIHSVSWFSSWPTELAQSVAWIPEGVAESRADVVA